MKCAAALTAREAAKRLGNFKTEAFRRMLKLVEPFVSEVTVQSVLPLQRCRVDGIFRVGERKLPLTDSEERVLAMLWEASPEAVSREAIFTALYLQEKKPGRAVIDVFVSGLRQKLKLAGDGSGYIVSVPRKGWALQGERCQRD